ncbi:MAG: hypothetical protein AAFQ79_04605 [Pseudomonadota bacterium]
MMRRGRTPFCLALVALIALTSVAFGAARGQTDATGRMVICSAHGVVVVYLDAQGNQTAPPHFCPDCVMTALSAVVSAGSAVQTPWQVRPAELSDLVLAKALQTALYRPGARAPPALSV